jgi:hypothetical protein
MHSAMAVRPSTHRTNKVPINSYMEVRMRRMLMALVLSVVGWHAAAQSPEEFKIETARDLVSLCAAEPTAPNYVAAIHFCHGFGAGAYHYYAILAEAEPGRKFVCVPQPGPTRTEAINGFVAWMKKNPQYLTGEAVDALFRYLGETYPCTK